MFGFVVGRLYAVGRLFNNKTEHFMSLWLR